MIRMLQNINLKGSMKGGGRGYIIYIRARNMCAQTEAGKRENRDSGYEEKKKTGEEGADR